jgi:hypothetical protein
MKSASGASRRLDGGHHVVLSKAHLQLSTQCLAVSTLAAVSPLAYAAGSVSQSYGLSSSTEFKFAWIPSAADLHALARFQA